MSSGRRTQSLMHPGRHIGLSRSAALPASVECSYKDPSEAKLRGLLTYSKIPMLMFSTPPCAVTSKNDRNIQIILSQNIDEFQTIHPRHSVVGHDNVHPRPAMNFRKVWQVLRFIIHEKNGTLRMTCLHRILLHRILHIVFAAIAAHLQQQNESYRHVFPRLIRSSSDSQRLN